MNYRLTALIDDHDVEGTGDTWEEMLLNYARDCRASAEQYQETVNALLEEAERCERLAKEGEKHGV